MLEKEKIEKTVNLEQLDLMLLFVIDKYPDIKNNYIQLADKITSEFKIQCYPRDIEAYYAQFSCGEDYELEGRKCGYRM